MSETPIHRCPTCGSAVIVAGGEDEPGEGGTRYYEPAGDVARLREALEDIRILAGDKRGRYQRGNGFWLTWNWVVRRVDKALGATEADHE